MAEGMKDRLRKFVVDTFLYGEGTVEDDQPLFESGIIDSLGFMKLLEFIGDEFGVNMDMSEVSMENFETINDMAATIEGKDEVG